MPLKPEEFKLYLTKFRKSREGNQVESDGTLSFINDELAYFEITAESVGKKRAAYEQQHPVYLKWKVFMDDYLKDAPESLKSGV